MKQPNKENKTSTALSMLLDVSPINLGNHFDWSRNPNMILIYASLKITIYYIEDIRTQWTCCLIFQR